MIIVNDHDDVFDHHPDHKEQTQMILTEPNTEPCPLTSNWNAMFKLFISSDVEMYHFDTLTEPEPYPKTTTE